MNIIESVENVDDQHLVKLAKNLLVSCSNNGFDYFLIKNLLDNTINQSVEAIISILHEDLNDSSYKNIMNSIKIFPLRRLAEEINNFKKESYKNTQPPTKKTKNDNFQEHENKFHIIQESIIKTAKQSKSPRIRAILNSTDLTKSEISIEKLQSILTIVIQEGEDTAQYRMAKLYNNILKILNKKEETDFSAPIDKSEKLILQTVSEIKEKVSQYTEQSLKTNSMQAQLIGILESQIEKLTNEINSMNDNQLFEIDVIDDFENSKYDELLIKYEKAFKKIEEMTNSRNELILRNGNLEAQNLLLQQKFNDSIDENNQLKKIIQDYIPENHRNQ